MEDMHTSKVSSVPRKSLEKKELMQLLPSSHKLKRWCRIFTKDETK